MAKRPDFAQKLLDDIRVRKEKMGLAPSGRQSAQTPSASGSNVQGISQRSLQRRRETTTNNFINKNSTEVTNIWLGTGKQKVPNYNVGSQDVVPFRKSAHSDYSIDVSMALALALSNSGKLRNIEFFSNATVGKKHIMHHGSLNFAETGKSTPNRSRHPGNQFHFPNLDVAEVSKGVQKLNKILEACTGGLRFDGNSIDFGRELLRGALDLEESLRMLVTLQDASDYMVGSQRKQVRLLKGKKDDESSSHEAKEKKSMSRPRFSFDEPRQHSHNLPKQKNDDSYLEHNRSAIFYLEKSKTPASNSNKSSSNASMKPTHQKRSPNCGPSSDPHFSCITTSYSNSGEHRSFKNENVKVSTPRNLKQLSESTPTGEKIRIPNVIAKLMGLEELPLLNAELKKEMNVNKISVIEAEYKAAGAQKMPTSKKLSEMDKISAIEAENGKEVDVMRYLVKEQNHMDSQKNNLQEKIITGKRIITPEAVRRKEIKKLRDQNGIEDSTPKHEAHPHLKVVNKKGTETKESKNSEDQARKWKAESILNSNKSFPEDNTQSTSSLPQIWHDDVASKKELVQRKKGPDLEGKKNIEAVHTNETQAVNNKVAPQQLITRRLKSDKAVHGCPKDKRHNERYTPNANLQNERELKLTNRSAQKAFSGNSTILAKNRSPIDMTNKEKAKVHAENNHQAQKAIKSRNTIYKDGEKKSDVNLGEVGTLKLEARNVKEKTAPLILEPALKKPEKILSVNKVHTTKGIAHRKGSDSNRESDPRRTKTTHENHQPLKDHSSFLQELEQRWKQRNHKDEGTAIDSHLMDSLENLKKQNTETVSLSCSCPLGDDCGEPLSTDRKLTTKIHVNESSDRTNTASAAQEPQEIAPNFDVEQKPVLEENHTKGPTESVRISSTPSLKNQAISEVDGQLSLTKNEQLLKQTLVSNRDFLNTAQAVFKIKIPVDILQAGEDSSMDEGRKLVLDCAYEVTRRKGKREEVMFAKKMSTAPVKLRCMDTLIKELNEDVESLKFTGKIGSNDSDTARYLNELIEREIQNRNPDVNSMWDFGWNNSTFADIEKDEIIRVVEKHVLNGLITELAIDLSNVGQC